VKPGGQQGIAARLGLARLGNLVTWPFDGTDLEVADHRNGTP
jgi:hypothetical protein